MKKLLFALTIMATFVTFTVAIAGGSIVLATPTHEPASMLVFGIGLFLLGKVAKK
jgi:hypothetical protein